MSRQEERAVAIALEGGACALEGIFVAGREPDPGGALIAPPHPLFGGNLESPVLAELAWAFQKAGEASLRFNWRGVGASAGERSGDAAAADTDLRAALAHLEETVSGPLAACGYSFGAAAALRAAGAHPRVRRLVLVAPPAELLDAAALARARRVLVIVGAEDEVAPPAELELLVADAPRAKLEVIDGADHYFGSGLAEISRLTYDWLGG